jgi:23S rRNA pseudouridine1911/1915/1917 synthase
MIEIPEIAGGQRIDRFLAETQPEHSRSYWQKEIKAGRVQINGKSVTPHHEMATTDILTITEASALAPIGAPPKLEIIAETTNYIVLNKPAGLLVHKTDTSHEPTLVDALLAHIPIIKEVGENQTRPGIVHRLDREASGVMVVAKTQAMFGHLKEQFASRTVQKTYTTLVHGVLTKDEDEITLAIGRSEHGGRMAARPASQEGKESITRYEVVKRFVNFTLVLAFPLTGRTHQIRAHFHAIGHPIAGDPLYRTKKQKEKMIPRLMLHATKLSFTDLAEKTHTFESPLPDIFVTFVSTLNPQP